MPRHCRAGSIDDESYTPEYPKGEWDYLKKGVIIKSDQLV